MRWSAARQTHHHPIFSPPSLIHTLQSRTRFSCVCVMYRLFISSESKRKQEQQQVFCETNLCCLPFWSVYVGDGSTAAEETPHLITQCCCFFKRRTSFTMLYVLLFLFCCMLCLCPPLCSWLLLLWIVCFTHTTHKQTTHTKKSKKNRTNNHSKKQTRRKKYFNIHMLYTMLYTYTMFGFVSEEENPSHAPHRVCCAPHACEEYIHTHRCRCSWHCHLFFSFILFGSLLCPFDVCCVFLAPHKKTEAYVL